MDDTVPEIEIGRVYARKIDPAGWKRRVIGIVDGLVVTRTTETREGFPAAWTLAMFISEHDCSPAPPVTVCVPVDHPAWELIESVAGFMSALGKTAAADLLALRAAAVEGQS